MTESTFASMNPAYAFAEEEAEADEAAATEENGEETKAEAYDPGEYTVAEVLDYLDKHPDESDAIYNAEVEGKARTSLLSHFEDEEEE